VARSNSLLTKRCLLKKALNFSAFFCVFICTLLVSPTINADVCPPQRIDETARVIHVYDGDTIKLEGGRKVRLLGIDTPEVFSKKRAIPSEIKASGERASAALKQLLRNADMRVGLAYGQQKQDRYGRMLAHVFTKAGVNVQAKLIQQGHAVAFTTPPNDRMSDCYKQQEEIARQSQHGIWQLSQYHLKQVHQLPSVRSGFQRVQGRVNKVKQSKRRITFEMGKLWVSIYKKDWPNFSLHDLKALQGKAIRVRGWLRKNKKGYSMNLRHPDAITEDLTTK